MKSNNFQAWVCTKALNHSLVQGSVTSVLAAVGSLEKKLLAEGATWTHVSQAEGCDAN